MAASGQPARKHIERILGPVLRVTSAAGALTGVVADRFGRVIVVWPTTPISGDGGGLDWSLRGTAGGFSAPRSLKATIRDSGAASASPKLAMQLTTEQPAGSRS